MFTHAFTLLHPSLNYKLLTPFIEFLLTYDILSQELHTLLQMAAPGASPRSDMFMAVFAIPTLLWRALNSVGYAEPTCYFWREVAAEGQPWYDVRVTIPALADNPQWQGWSIESDGQSPWEGAQVVPLEALSEICQEFGVELINGPARTFPRWICQ